MTFTVKVLAATGEILSLGGTGPSYAPSDLLERRVARKALTEALTLLDLTAPSEETVIDREAKTAWLGGKDIKLTATEFAIVAFLAERPGHWRSRQQIMDAIGMSLETEERSVDSHIRRARRKGASRIETQYGLGYRWLP